MKKSKWNYQSVTLPIFALVTLNLLFSIGLNANAKTQTEHVQQTVTQTTVANTAQAQPQSSMAMFLKAVQQLQNTKNVTIKSSGELKSFVTQKIKLTRMYDGVTHYSENITTGLKNAANRIYYTNDYAVVNMRGTEVSNNSVNWNGKVSNYTLSEFIEKFHMSPTAFLPYDISAVSIIGASIATPHATGYEFAVNLHPKLATKAYAKNLQVLSKLSNEINFQSVTLHVVLNDKFEFVKVMSDEVYTIQIMGIPKQCTSHVTTTFDFVTKANIPSIS